MSVRSLATMFFILYGAAIPVAASGFMAENLIATLAMMGSCWVIAALLRSRRAILLNILIATYVFRVYLTRPYIDVFFRKLQGIPLNYIYSLNYEHSNAQSHINSLDSFYNPSDAAVVYLSLLSLLSTWLIGLYALRLKQGQATRPPWIFSQVDEIVTSAAWPFWLAMLLLSYLNFQYPAATMRGAMLGHGERLFAWGLFSTSTITVVCLYSVLHSHRPRAQSILLIPVLYSAVVGSISGSRGAIFTLVVQSLAYGLFLNWERRIGWKDLRRVSIPLALLLATTIAGAIVSQYLRLIWRSGTDIRAVLATATANLDVSSLWKSLPGAVYLSMTELLHRASSLKPQFLILNNHYVHNPWETFNPLQTLMRIFNDLVPGDPFHVIGINRLFDHIYYDRFVNYNSEAWSVQGVLYLYFGLGFSPVVAFLLGCLTARFYPRFEGCAEASPAFAAFAILLFNEFIEFGTFERIIPVDIVRPLTSFLGVILLVKMFRSVSAALPREHASTERRP